MSGFVTCLYRNQRLDFIEGEPTSAPFVSTQSICVWLLRPLFLNAYAIFSEISLVFDEERAYAIIVGPAPLKETLKAPADIAASITSLKPGISFARYG